MVLGPKSAIDVIEKLRLFLPFIPLINSKIRSKQGSLMAFLIRITYFF